jgi:ketosteroid isomerase-like protein
VHPNEELLRREYEARAARDDAALAKIVAEDVIWHVPGKNAIAGDYRDQVMEYVRRRRELAEGAFDITVHDVLANDEHGLVIATGRAIRGGTAFKWRAHGLYRFRDGRIAECWVAPGEPVRVRPDLELAVVPTYVVCTREIGGSPPSLIINEPPPQGSAICRYCIWPVAISLVS